MSNPSIQAVLPKVFATRGAGSQLLLSRAVSSVVSAARGIWQFVQAVADVPDELRRTADEWTSTRPEQAARLRKAMRQSWGC
jgi:hypothetical protein